MQRMLRAALLTATCAWLGSVATMRLEPEMGWDLGATGWHCIDVHSPSRPGHHQPWAPSCLAKRSPRTVQAGTLGSGECIASHTIRATL